MYPFLENMSFRPTEKHFLA